MASTLLESDYDMDKTDLSFRGADINAFVKVAAGMLPIDLDAQRVFQIITKYGGCAYFLNEPDVAAGCRPKTFAKSRQYLIAGKVTHKSFDGDEIGAVVADLNRVYHPSFTFDLSNEGCDCNEPATAMCSHLTALMIAWVQDKRSFLPINVSPNIMQSDFGEFLTFVTGEHDYTRGRAKLLNTPLQAGKPVSEDAAHAVSTKSSTGKAAWPVARSGRLAQPPFNQTIEAEFNTAQLRELAKNLGIKLKGTSKSAFVEQVTSEMATRAARMRLTPEVLLEGLTDDQANLVRRAMTARDYHLPLPRNLVNNLWTQLTNRDPDKRAADALDALRRRAILFPTRNNVGYRDVYYQWLPLEAAGGNVPLMKWGVRPILAREKSQRTDAPNPVNFLDALEMFIGALLSSGTEVRASLQRHPKTDMSPWLQHWEHRSEEAEHLLNSRPGWVPNPTSGISVPLLSPLTRAARSTLENQTGLSAPYCDFLFGIAAALQLIEAPDIYSTGPYKLLKAPWKVSARTSAIEEWFALSDEDKFMRAWTAWREQVFFAFEAMRAAHGAYGGITESSTGRFQVMRAIGAREFNPPDLAAEWAALRCYITRILYGLPNNEWISWRDLRKQLYEFYPECQWSLYGQEQWWFTAPGKVTRLDLNRYDDWQQTVGAVLENIIAEPLRWFGVVEVEAGNPTLETFRLTALHEWLTRVQPIAASDSSGQTPLLRLPAGAQPRPRVVEPVKWLSDGSTGLAQWKLPPAPDRADFIGFARKVADATGSPFTYALTPASIERAIGAGITLEEVAQHFERAGAPMPDAARALYQSIAERFGRIRLYESLTILQLADDYALRELMSATSLGQHVVYQISPRAVVVNADAVDGLVAEMIAKGYTPGVK